MTRRMFLFPGQGAQYVGMGRDFYEQFERARTTFEEADEFLGFPLSTICFDGPQDKLNITSIQQPAILVTSIAMLRSIQSLREDFLCDAAAGLSLGEYTALVAAGAIDFADAVTLVRKRGAYMQEAAEATAGGMASVIGMEDNEVIDACKKASESGRVVAANFNCPGQVVISGEKAALEAACKLCEERGAKMIIPLEVSGAFHSPLMQPAFAKLAYELERVEIRGARIPVVSNVSGDFVQSAEDIRESLTEQLCSPVLWRASMERCLRNGFGSFCEIGPGKVLAGLMKRIERKAQVVNINKVEACLREAQGNNN